MANKKYAAQRKFAKLSNLNADIDVGGHIGMAARKEKSKLSDVWMKRSTTNVHGFFDKAKARAIKRGAV